MELCRRDPVYFRDNLVVNRTQRLGDVISPVQRADFDAISPAMKYIAGVSDEYPQLQKFYIQRSRGYSKTTDDAINALWTFAFCKKKIVGYAAAEDKDQSKLLLEQAAKVIDDNPWLNDFIDIQRNCIRNRQNDAVFYMMSRDVGSSFGLNAQYMLAQEWTHWSQSAFFSSFYSSYAKEKDRGAILVVSCNAGSGRDWKWQFREAVMHSEDWYKSVPDGWAPWYTEATIEEQRHGLPPDEFERLWLNRWTDSSGGYISLTEADSCINNKLSIRDTTESPGWAYVAALDYAEKTDRTAGVVTHQLGSKILVDRMDVIAPELCENRKVPVNWCRTWMRNIAQQFGKVYFVVDPWQLKSIIQELREEGFFIEEFEFKSGSGNWQLSKVLRQLVLNERIEWYPGCGQILDQYGKPWLPRGMRDDLCTELAALNVKPLAGDRWRLEHNTGDHDDRAFALGAACLFIVENSGGFSDIFA